MEVNFSVIVLIYVHAHLRAFVAAVPCSFWGATFGYILLTVDVGLIFSSKAKCKQLNV